MSAEHPGLPHNGMMLLHELVDAWSAMKATHSRLAKRRALADVLRIVPVEEAAIATSYLSGVLRQRRTGVGARSIGEPPQPASRATLTLTGVDAAFAAMAALSGPGSQGRRTVALNFLMASATAEEQRYLSGLITGELRQGALDALVVDSLARAIDAPIADVRRAVMLAGSTSLVAEAALRDGPAALSRFTLRLRTPVRPMLASSATSVTEALEALGGEAILDAKLDGIRVQVHKDGQQVGVFTRTLEDITDRVPELVRNTSDLPVEQAVLDGEALLAGSDGRPRPFQDSSARIASRSATSELSVFFFDLLHVNGRDLFDEPAHVRFAELARLVPPRLLVDRLVATDGQEAEGFFRRSLDAGHEGVVAKSPNAPYEAGRRGAGWLKVKPVHTLDLVVLAVEWGSGRRSGKLSNIHLGARDGDGFLMLGKTFKGMTDEILQWQTEHFLRMQTRRSGHVVHVRPEQVVEIAFDGLQRSTRYPGGVALRFARVLRYRHDKSASEASSLAEVLDLLPKP